MSGYTRTFQSAILSTLVGTFVGLFSVAPSVDGAGTEFSGGGYARAASNMGGLYAVNDASRIYNTSPITWPTPTTDWGAPAAWALFANQTGGSPLVWGLLPGASTIYSGDAVFAPTNTLGVTEA